MVALFQLRFKEMKSIPSLPSKILWIILNGVCFVGAIALIRDTAENGHDFTVFWRSARLVLDGQPLYSVARDGAMVFKYPPWILPSLLPLALLPLDLAKILWGFVEVFSIFGIALWIKTEL